jgi:hypothetical protein
MASVILRRARGGDAQTRPIPDQVDDAIRALRGSWSLARIGEHLNVDPITVLNRLREHGIPTRAPTDAPERSAAS